MRTHSLGHPDDLDTDRRPARFDLVRGVARVVDFAFGLLYTLLVLRFALDFLGARPEAGFVQMLRRATDVFYAPFRGIFPAQDELGGHVVWSLLVALVAYVVLHGILRGLLRLLPRA
jgi:uncharacterized protein YggT (Ycf19 family)